MPKPVVKSATQSGKSSRADLHETVTAKIVAAIEAGAGDWHMPWHRPGTSFDIPRNALTEKRYQGCNILSLWIDADEKKFPTQSWATFKQWQEIGAQVRKGEKGSLIVKYGRWTPKGDKGPKATSPVAESGDGSEAGERLYARAAFVFNAAQVDGFTNPDDAPRADLTTRLAHVDAFIAATGAEFREGGTRAFYRHPSSRGGAHGDGDFIQMPPRNLFTGTATSTPTEAYESTRLHELSHWSGAEHRLKREFGARFGDHRYAVEELVAELSASFLCAELAITNTPRPDHAQYLAHWLAVLKQDSRAIFTAAAAASRACAYLMGLQPGGSAEDGSSEDAADGQGTNDEHAAPPPIQTTDSRDRHAA
jgi:antirestriction protein ArdC